MFQTTNIACDMCGLRSVSFNDIIIVYIAPFDDAPLLQQDCFLSKGSRRCGSWLKF